MNRGSSLRLAATYSPTIIAVPSALTGLTSLFGMGRGGTPSLKPPKSSLNMALISVFS